MFVFVLCLVFILGLTFIFRVSRAAETAVYIRADGSVDPPTEPISTLDNVTYTLNDNSNSTLFIERDNITFNGNGHSLLGTMYVPPPGPVGLYCQNRTNITVMNTTIASLTYVIYCSDSAFSRNNMTGGFTLDSSDNNTLFGNRIGGTAYGMVSLSLHISTHNNLSGNYVTDNGLGLYASYYNTISKNNITNSLQGIYLSTSGSNLIVDNNVTNITTTFIGLSNSLNNIIYHNNFINGRGVSITDSGPPRGNNTWDNGFPSGGNYWAGYNATAMNATEIDSSGIWSKPYEMVPGNVDNYPLMHPIPEFPTYLILPLFFTATLLAVIIYRRKHRERAK